MPTILAVALASSATSRTQASRQGMPTYTPSQAQGLQHADRMLRPSVLALRKGVRISRRCSLRAERQTLSLSLIALHSIRQARTKC